MRKGNQERGVSVSEPILPAPLYEAVTSGVTEARSATNVMNRIGR